MRLPPKTLCDAIRQDRLDLDYAGERNNWIMVSEAQAVLFLHAVGSIGAQGGPPRQPHPVLCLSIQHIGVEIVSVKPDVPPVQYRDWFARLQKDDATFDIIEFERDGKLTDAVRVHVKQARIFGDPDITPLHVECWVAVASVEAIDPYDPPEWDPASGV